MVFNKLPSVSHTDGAAAVGPDLSWPLPIYRPPRHYQTNLLNPMILLLHYGAKNSEEGEEAWQLFSACPNGGWQ